MSKLIEKVKDFARPIVLNRTSTYELHSYYKKRQLLKEYRQRRERYWSICREKGLEYSENESVEVVRKRISSRGYSVMTKELGEVHTFTFIPRLNWHNHLYDDLYELGPVSEFDSVKLGFDRREFLNGGEKGLSRRREMNELFLSTLQNTHKAQPVDWVFIYAGGKEISASTIRRIQESIGVPVVGMCLDDKQSWIGKWMGDQWAGQVSIASALDLAWTSARVACGWYLAEGGRPVYMPEGCNANVYRPMEVSRDIQVSFIGGAYGFRKRTIGFLQRYGIPVQLFGYGWNTRCVWNEEAVEVINRSLINLGMGGIGYCEELTNVKTRDFEIPCVGRGMYLTSFNPDLAMHFDVGREIVCYRNNDELLELLRYYLAHKDEALEIARLGRQRCLREHRWLHRYIHICRALGILK